MIYVKKEALNIPEIKIAAKAELNKFLLSVSRKSGTGKFDFIVYKNPKIKEVLINLFSGKCAYCESRITNHPEEVEHFRPKSSITGKDGKKIKPGYYWLAADWNNLLISCIDCNRARTHPVPGEGKKLKIGKQDQFPIEDETKRWNKHTSRKGKETEDKCCLLIHPCEEDPEKYFYFDENGLIIPDTNLKDLYLAKAQTSIRVYALQRMGLVNERKEWYIEKVKERLIDIALAKNALANETNAANIAILNQQINRKLKQLLELTKPNQPYSAMVKCLLKKELPGLLGSMNATAVSNLQNPPAIAEHQLAS